MRLVLNIVKLLLTAILCFIYGYLIVVIVTNQEDIRELKLRISVLESHQLEMIDLPYVEDDLLTFD